MGCVYKITNPNGKIYVGQTYNLKVRIVRYRHLNCDKQRMLYNSFKKHGFENHVIEILEDNLPVECLNEREIFWINECKSYYKENREFGMNLNKGGNTPVWDKERVEKFSEMFVGSKNPFYGKTHSKENLEKFSRSTKEQLRKSGYKISRESTELGLNAVRKKTLTYNKEGHFVKEYPSLTSCAIDLGVDPTTIRDAMRTNGLVRGKHFCTYKTTDEYPLFIDIPSKKKQRA